MLPPEIKQSLFSLVGDQRPTRSCSSMETSPGVEREKKSLAEDTRLINVGSSNENCLLREESNDPLCQQMVRAGIANCHEKAAKRFDVSSMLKKKNYNVQVA